RVSGWRQFQARKSRFELGGGSVCIRNREIQTDPPRQMGCGQVGFRMRLTLVKFSRTNPQKQEFGLLMVKSPRKMRTAGAVSAGVLALSFAGWFCLQAQDPPQAPTPKPIQTGVASSSAQSQAPQTTDPPPQNDTRGIIRTNVNLVVLPV